MNIVYSEFHKQHNTNEVALKNSFFTETPNRIEVILDCIQQAKIGAIHSPIDHGLKPIYLVHDKDFIEFLRKAYVESEKFYKETNLTFTPTFKNQYRGNKPKDFLGLREYYAFSGSTPILSGTWNAAYWSVQCALTAVDISVKTGKATYALCRPPGHHAATDLYGGYCYLNNAAIAARYLQQLKGPVCILDIDYHHGNGTQEIFYRDSSVLYCSIHANPDDDFPYYWGREDERGEGQGEGYNYNWILPQGTDDEAYLGKLSEALDIIRKFNPSYLVVSLGLDIVENDPEGGFAVTTDGIRAIGRKIASLKIPTVIIQEGGYLVEHLGINAVEFLRAFV